MGPLALPYADPEQLDPGMIRHKIRRVVYEPSFTKRARIPQAEIAELAGPEQVAHLVEALLAPEGRNVVSTLNLR